MSTITVQAFERWDPRTGARAPLWQGAAGKQDIVLASSGDWLATVRTGLALPFPEWQLILRNVTTGEARTIARNEGTVADAPDLQPGLPFGFAPKPVMDGATVTWIQYAGSAESPVRELRAYDLVSGSVTTLDTVALAVGDLEELLDTMLAELAQAIRQQKSQPDDNCTIVLARQTVWAGKRANRP